MRVVVFPRTILSAGMPSSIIRFSTWSFIGSAYRSAKSRGCSAWSCQIGRSDGDVPIIAGMQKKSRVRWNGSRIPRRYHLG